MLLRLDSRESAFECKLFLCYRYHGSTAKLCFPLYLSSTEAMTFYLGTPPSRDAIHLLPAYEPSLILSPVAAVLHPFPYLVTLAVVAYDLGLLLF